MSVNNFRESILPKGDNPFIKFINSPETRQSLGISPSEFYIPFSEDVFT